MLLGRPVQSTREMSTALSIQLGEVLIPVPVGSVTPG